MKERKKRKVRQPSMNIRPNAPQGWKSPICNFMPTCVKSLTNLCMFCIKNYAVWEGGFYEVERDGKKMLKPSQKKTPRNLMDQYVKKPENI